MNAKVFAEELVSQWMNAWGQHSSDRGPSSILPPNLTNHFTVLHLCSSTPFCLPSSVKLSRARTLSCYMFTECLTQIRLLDTNIIKIHYSKNLISFKNLNNLLGKNSLLQLLLDKSQGKLINMKLKSQQTLHSSALMQTIFLMLPYAAEFPADMCTSLNLDSRQLFRACCYWLKVAENLIAKVLKGIRRGGKKAHMICICLQIHLVKNSLEKLSKWQNQL